jgi:hypothetical protein|tara:strand:+ start:842 stop:1153 length:312 start_codon:yes stop_codon:yes gene_type:complete
MSKDPFNEESSEKMSLEEKIEYENYIVEQAFENSYMVLTKKASFEDLLDVNDKYGLKAIMIYNPSDEPDEDVYNDTIYYYEDLEEYEKCAELLKIKNKIFNNV